MTMIGALNSVEKEKRRHSELPPFHQMHHKSSLPHYHYDPCIAAAAAEGAIMGVEGAKFGPLSHQILPPKPESAKQVSSRGVQIFLCLLGALLTASVSLWMAIFSKDSLARRTLISGTTAACALIFTLIAYAAFKKRRRKAPLDDIEISQSILREHRKSITNSLRKSTANGDELLRQIRRHSSVIAVDHARQQLLMRKHEEAKEAANLLSVDGTDTPTKQQQQLKRERASTSN